MEEENSENSEDKFEYEMMVTRSGLLYLNQVEEDPPTSKQNRKSSRSMYVKLTIPKLTYEHQNVTIARIAWTFLVLMNYRMENYQHCSRQLLIFLTCQDNDMCHKKNVTRNSCLDVVLPWVYCNVYSAIYKTVKKKLEDHLQTYRTLRKYDHNKRKDKYWENVETFSGKFKSIFDSSRTTSQEKLWGVKMTPTDDKFYEQQCKNLQAGSWSTFVDRKWHVISLRKKHENYILEKSRESFQVLLFICHFSLVCLALFVLSDQFFYNRFPQWGILHS